MKKVTIFLVLLVVFSTILIAGCTQQQQPGATPTRTPVVTLPTVPGQINQTVANLTNKTEQKVANLSE
jgi:outer membrane murein-binding lipoprotein Lpp